MIGMWYPLKQKTFLSRFYLIPINIIHVLKINDKYDDKQENVLIKRFVIILINILLMHTLIQHKMFKIQLKCWSLFLLDKQVDRYTRSF